MGVPDQDEVSRSNLGIVDYLEGNYETAEALFSGVRERGLYSADVSEATYFLSLIYRELKRSKEIKRLGSITDLSSQPEYRVILDHQRR